VLDLIGAAARAIFTGNASERRRIKGLRAIRAGYQQSYPQKLWKSPETLPNQALGARTEGDAQAVRPQLAQFALTKRY
jgi:hypothetical protein